jgi:hypothetical protein
VHSNLGLIFLSKNVTVLITLGVLKTPKRRIKILKNILLILFVITLAPTFIINADYGQKPKIVSSCEYTVEQWGNLKDGVIIYFNIPIQKVDSELADDQPWYEKAKMVDGVATMGLVGRYELMFYKSRLFDEKVVGRSVAIQVCNQLGYKKIKEKKY